MACNWLSRSNNTTYHRLGSSWVEGLSNTLSNKNFSNKNIVVLGYLLGIRFLQVDINSNLFLGMPKIGESFSRQYNYHVNLEKLVDSFLM